AEATMTPSNDNFPSPHRRGPARDPLVVKHPNAAGIDIHDGVHVVCVPPDRDDQPVRSFRTNTCDLEAIAAWLKKCGSDTVVLESTGVYWVPLYELLERHGFSVWLVDPHAVKKVPGRPKTDVHDAQWLQRLHCYGLLGRAFRPADSIVVLRGLVRQRDMLIRY